jgi:ABC-2 type transport system ATP-binding protein
MLRVEGLTKHYLGIPVVDRVSFEVRAGEILGYLGPNGSGKSTTVKMICGLLTPSSGTLSFDGRPLTSSSGHPFLTRMGYVPEEAQLYTHLTGNEYLRFIGRIRGIPRDILEMRITSFLRLLSLADAASDPMHKYSKGMRQKVLLASALLHNPDLLILDEPFSGLDVGAALMLRSLLQGLARDGKAILFSSHVLEVVEKVCASTVILYQGKVVAYDTIANLRALRNNASLEAVFAELAVPDNTDEIAGELIAAMKAA